MSVLGPDGPWPRHPKAWWHETLDLARERGWSLRVVDGHSWGKIFCPRGCKIAVFSSGRGGETAARSARRKIERCVHGAVSPLARAIRSLDAAQRLTDAAAELLARQACHDEVEEMLNLADTALSAADEAELLARISDLPETAVVAPNAVLDDAEAHVATATSQLRGLSAPVAKPHRHVPIKSGRTYSKFATPSTHGPTTSLCCPRSQSRQFEPRRFSFADLAWSTSLSSDKLGR